MRKIREVLRLKYEAGLSTRAIALSVNAGRTTVQEYLQRFAASGLSWPAELDDTALESRLFPPPPPAGTARPEPDWTVRPTRAAAQGGHPVAPLAGIQGAGTRRVPVFVVL